MRDNPGAVRPHVLAALELQIRHQLREQRKRMTWWIPWIFVVGFFVSVLGLDAAIDAFRSEHRFGGLVLFGFFAFFFGSVVFQWLFADQLIRPRIVPYFERELGPWDGPTIAAFRRGRAIYKEAALLDELAASRGVTPLSAFGFEYDHYGQDVRWHPAADGLRTVEALRAGVAGLTPALAADLDALAKVLGTAAEQGVAFALVLRLHAKDSMQLVMGREERQGSFW